MKKLNFNELLLRIFIPTIIVSLDYLILGRIVTIPHLLLFCLLGTFLLVPIELGFILTASKREFGTYSLKSAFVGQEKMPLWKTLIIAFVFFGIAGLLSAFIAPVENQIFADVRATVLSKLAVGFDWANLEYLKSFSRPILIVSCVYYGIFNVLVAPVVEELFFRGYLTSHYERQTSFTPILITILFSLYHFWLPFNNVFRILAFTPVAYVAYKKRNIYISIFFHCFCNLFSSIGFVTAVLG